MQIPPKLVALSELEQSPYDNNPDLTPEKAQDFVASLAQTNGLHIWVYGSRILKGRYRVACLRLLCKKSTIVHDIKPAFDQFKWTRFVIVRLDFLYSVFASVDAKIYAPIGLDRLGVKEAQTLLFKLRAIRDANAQRIVNPEVQGNGVGTPEVPPAEQPVGIVD